MNRRAHNFPRNYCGPDKQTGDGDGDGDGVRFGRGFTGWAGEWRAVRRLARQ